MIRRARYLMLSRFLCGLLFAVLATAQSNRAELKAVNSSEAAKWKEDLRYLAQEMPRRHKNLFHTMTREQFDTAVRKLDERIPTLARHQIIVEMMRIVAMVGDGHTSLKPEFNPKIGFRYYAIKFFYGDHDFILLPNSGISVAVSSLWWQTMNPRDTRPWITPQIRTELTSDNYRRNVDPAFEAILNYKSIVGVLTPALQAHNMVLVIKQYRDFKTDPRTRSINTESEINALGYQLLSMNRTADATEIFKLNVESYPDSANVHDSLGDAYSQNGNRELAIRSYERALQLSPSNDHTAEKLGKLRSKQ